MENIDDLESVLHAVHEENGTSASHDYLRDHFEETKLEFFRELETAVVAINETPTEVYEETLESIAKKYFDALLTFQQAELKEITLAKARRWDETTQSILTKLLENYG